MRDRSYRVVQQVSLLQGLVIVGLALQAITLALVLLWEYRFHQFRQGWREAGAALQERTPGEPARPLLRASHRRADAP